MITYKSSDIIRRAMQIADLENSSFISFQEKIALLNECYQALYQKGINHDTNAFVRYINTQSTVIHLPRDFHQLKAITVGSDQYIHPVLRRPANQSFDELSYDMINNTIQINGSIGSNTITVEYYPTPSTLTLPNEPMSIEVDDTILAMRGSVYVTGSDNQVVIQDLNSTFTDTLDEEGIASYQIHMEEDYITLIGTDTIFYSMNTGLITRTSNPAIFYRGKTYQLMDGKLYSPNADYALYTLNANIGECKQAVVNNTLDKYVGLNGNTVVIDGVVQQYKGNKLFYHSNQVYITDSTDSIHIHSFEGKDVAVPADYAVDDIVGINPDTGYGYLGRRMKKYYIVSYYDDTVLNFPKNTYFSFLAYLLALSFKTKQGSDTTALSVLCSNAEQAFYDSLPRDDWNATRITNMYN